MAGSEADSGKLRAGPVGLSLLGINFTSVGQQSMHALVQAARSSTTYFHHYHRPLWVASCHEDVTSLEFGFLASNF